MKPALAVLCLAVGACARGEDENPASATLRHPPLHATGAFARADPTVRGAHLVPEFIDSSLGTLDPSGTVRGFVDGVRFVSTARGSVQSADQRLDGVSTALGIPARLGGGYLFTVGDTVVRTDDWLSDPRAIFRSPRGILGVTAGLDRIYVHTNGGHVALDAVSGALADMGPWPTDPFVHALIAFDGWRALALTDFRGAVVTSNAGRSWERLDLPLRPVALTPVRRTTDHDGWFAVAPDGEGAPVDAVVVSDAALLPAASSSPDVEVRCVLVDASLGVSALVSCGEVQVRARVPARTMRASPTEESPLRAAVEDGWPLENGTAMVADHGRLVLVSLTDGSVLEVEPDAYDASFGRCHAVSLGRRAPPSTHSAFGFVCGKASGRTALFAYDEDERRLRGVRAFATPRIVQTSPSGAWLVQGHCNDEEWAPDTPRASSAACVGMPTGEGAPYTWLEVRLEDVAGAAIGLTSDGKIARITPEDALGESRLELTSPEGQTTVVPLRLAETTFRRFVARAMWLGGLEEVRPGVLAGWLAGDGTVVGAQVDADGTFRIGAHVREMGSPFVAGRYGLGWTRSHRGYETTDGGVTWRPFVAPSPLSPSDVRACGPAGCVGDGWLRIGWGERVFTPPAPPEPLPRIRRAKAPLLALVCNADSSDAAHADAMRAGRSQDARQREFPPPALALGDTLLRADVYRAFDVAPRLLPLGRVYAWGPGRTDWGGMGRWEVWWRSPFASAAGAVSSAVSAAPFQDADGARATLGIGRAGPSWTVLVSDDAAHALLVVRRHAAMAQLYALDEGGEVAPVVRLDGTWANVEAALRVGAEWFIVETDDTRRGLLTLLRADSHGARTVATLERVLPGVAGGSVRLARGATAASVGLVVDGELLPDRNVTRRWLVPIDIDSGEILAPEPLGAADMSDLGHVMPCGDSGASGWAFDTPWPDAEVSVALAEQHRTAALRQVFARVRVSSDRTCVERLTGEATDEQLDQAGVLPSRRPGDGGPTLPVVLMTGTPLELQCSSMAK